MSVNNSKLRNGRFTSSQIYRLCKSLKSGKPTEAFYGYVEEVYVERSLGRSSKPKVKTQPMKWGKLGEVILFNLLGMEYSMAHKDTREHPKYGEFYSGTTDLLVTGVKTGEIKCFEPLHYGKLCLTLLTKDTEIVKQREREAYWQVVSNSIIYGVDRAEIIAYMPYKKELQQIIELCEDPQFMIDNGLEPSDYYFMRQENIEALPYLPDDSPMSNINTFEFEVPKQDKDFLIERILMANEELKKL